MSDGGSRAAAVVLGVLGALAAGCANCEDNPEVKFNLETAVSFYRAGKFADAVGRFEAALEQCSDSFNAWIGMGNACREYGNDLFRGVHDLVLQKRTENARQMFDDGILKHKDSATSFAKAMSLRRDSPEPHYGLGLLYFQRATSPIAYPFRLDDTKSREEELRRAVREFETVVGKIDSSLHAHRHLGLALFRLGRMDEGREHLSKYHDLLQAEYDRLFKGLRSGSDEQKKRREETLRTLEKDLEEVRSLILVFHDELQQERLKLMAREGSRSPEEDQRLARITRELLQLEHLAAAISASRLGPEERALKERCLQYLKSFNNGRYDECLSYLTAEPGKEEESRRKLADRIDREMKYKQFAFKGVSVIGEEGSVALACEIQSKEGSRPKQEVVFRWRRVGGQWFIWEQP
jgi:tetratricopeptide (TPR) repeat protein